jgi:molybdopterin converting factor small subunit
VSQALGPGVRVVLPGVLRELAGGAAELDVPCPEGAVVRDVLDAALAGRPLLGTRVRDETGAVRRHVNVFLDGRDVRFDAGQETPVRAGDVIHILPSVSGG